MKNDNDFQVHLPLEILQKKVLATKIHGAIEKNLNDKKKTFMFQKFTTWSEGAHHPILDGQIRALELNFLLPFDQSS